MSSPPPIQPITTPGKLQVADLLIVRTNGLASEMIRLGSALLDRPNIDNHVAFVHHPGDAAATWWWLLEGRPGGVGWRDSRDYTSSHWTLNNTGQPGRTLGDRMLVAKKAEAMLGTSYDWAAITADVANAFRIPPIWGKTWKGTTPGQVVCSAYASVLYDWKGWAHPELDTDRDTTPGDWDDFVLSNGYNVALS